MSPVFDQLEICNGGILFTFGNANDFTTIHIIELIQSYNQSTCLFLFFLTISEISCYNSLFFFNCRIFKNNFQQCLDEAFKYLAFEVYSIELFTTVPKDPCFFVFFSDFQFIS